MLFPIAEKIWLAQEIELNAIDVISINDFGDQFHIMAPYLGVSVIEPPGKIAWIIFAKEFRFSKYRIMKRMIKIIVVMDVIHANADPRSNPAIPASIDDVCRVIDSVLLHLPRVTDQQMPMLAFRR